MTNPSPKQFYAADYSAFKKDFCSFLKDKKISTLCVLTDSVKKHMSPSCTEDVTSFFCQNLLADDFQVKHLLALEQTEAVHASQSTLEKIKHSLAAFDFASTAFVALGSGTITDLLKHALYEMAPCDNLFICIPTALTVTAYTSHFSVIDINGIKRTRPSQNSQAVFWIEPLLQAAPMRLTRAGYGDLLACFCAQGDWFLAHKLGIAKSYNETAHQMMRNHFQQIKDAASAVGSDVLTPTATQNLCHALADSGIAMSLAGETTPLSGYEHAISHGLDFLHLNQNKPLPLHGEQVALACLASCTSFDWLLEQDQFDPLAFRLCDEKSIQQLIKKFLFVFELDKPDFISTFFNDAISKHLFWTQSQTQLKSFFEQWSVIKQDLRHFVLPANDLENILKSSGLPFCPESTNPKTTAMEYRWAIRFSPFIRNRFSLSDFLFWIGQDPCLIAVQ